MIPNSRINFSVLLLAALLWLPACHTEPTTGTIEFHGATMGTTYMVKVPPGDNGPAVSKSDLVQIVSDALSAVNQAHVGLPSGFGALSDKPRDNNRADARLRFLIEGTVYCTKCQ